MRRLLAVGGLGLQILAGGLGLQIWAAGLSLPGTAAAAGESTPLGPLAADVTSREATIWARAEGASRVRVVISDGKRRISRTQDVHARNDHVVQVRFLGLAPDTEYRYEVGLRRGWMGWRAWGPPLEGRLRTAPADSDPRAVRVAWSGDVAGQNVCRDAAEGFPAFTALGHAAPDLFIGLGDMIYADDTCAETGAFGNQQVPGGFEAATDLEGFRAHWRYVREDPKQARFLARTPYIAVWDDHEVLNDFGPWHDQAEGSDVPLLPLGLKAFLEYNPISTTARDDTRLYRNLRWGQHLEIFVLDTRQHRDPNAAADARGPGGNAIAKSLLGGPQREWLESSLEASDATWKVVVSSVPMSIPTGSSPEERGRDGWADHGLASGFETELLGILEFLRGRGARGIVWISTDAHFAEVLRYTPFESEPGFQVIEAVVGPLNAGLFPQRELDQTLRPEVLFFHGPEEPVESFSEALHWFNFGLLDVDAAGVLTIRVMNALGEELFAHSLGAGPDPAAPDSTDPAPAEPGPDAGPGA